MSANKLDLNQKIEKLDTEVEWFYSDEFRLEDAVKKYKAAIKLAKEIEADLDSLKNEIEVLTEDFSESKTDFGVDGIDF